MAEKNNHDVVLRSNPTKKQSDSHTCVKVNKIQACIFMTTRWSREPLEGRKTLNAKHINDSICIYNVYKSAILM